MAETIDRLQVVIAAQTEDFNKKMEEVNAKLDSLKNVSNSSTSGISNIQSAMTKAAIAGNLITEVVRKAVSGFTGLLKTVVQNGSEFARIKVATETVTRNLGMTTEQVNGLRDSLAESNTYGTKAEEIIKTLAMSGLVDMANGLKVVKAGTDKTVEGAGALVYTMKDLAAAAGVESAEGIDRLTKFIRRGEATFADGIIEIGSLSYEYSQYAQSLGKTASELTATERAQVRFNIVMKEGEKVYGTYANIMQTSAKAWDSAIAVIRTIREAVGGYLEPALSVIANGFYQITNGFRNAIYSSAGIIQQWAQKVAAYFVVVVRVIGRLLSRIPYIGKYFQGMATFSVKSLNSVTKAASSTSDGYDELTDSVNGTSKAMEKLASFDEMNVLTEENSGGSSSIGGAGGIEDIISDDSAGEFSSNADIINGIADELEQKFNNAIPTFKKFAKGLLAIATAIGTVKLALDGIKAFGSISSALNVLTKSIGAIGTETLAVTGIVAGLIAVFAGMYANSEKFRTSINNLVSTAIQQLKTEFQIIIDIASIFYNIFKIITSFLGDLFAPIIDRITNYVRLFNKALEVVSDSLNVSSSWLSKFTDTLLGNERQEIKNTEAVEAHNRANEELIASTKELDSAQADLTNAQLSLMDAEDRVATRQKVVNDLEAQGDTTSRAYQRAQLELKSAQDDLKRSQDRVVESQNRVQNAAVNVTNATNNLKNAEQNLQQQSDNMNPKGMESFADRVKNAFNTASSSINDSFGNLRSKIKDHINTLIYYINVLISGLDKIKIPEGIPGIGGKNINIPPIPYLAQGGIVDNPTVALLGESGREAVVPLENTAWIDKLADKINTGGNQNLTIKIGEQTLYEGVIDFINDKSMRTGTKLLNI